MGDTSSYCLNNVIKRNYVCFAPFNHGYNQTDKENSYYIIEEYKLKHTSLEDYLLYLDLVNKFIPITVKTQEKYSYEIHIYPNLDDNVNLYVKLVILGMFIRYPYEDYNDPYGVDKGFIEVYKLFLHFYKLCPDYDLCKLFLTAFNIEIVKYPRHNYNHSFAGMEYFNTSAKLSLPAIISLQEFIKRINNTKHNKVSCFWGGVDYPVFQQITDDFKYLKNIEIPTSAQKLLILLKNIENSMKCEN